MARSSRNVSIPAFTLYGESLGPSVEMLHIEAIQSRSQRHRWEIDAHTHQGLHQVLWVASGPAEVFLEDTRAACHGPLAVVIPPGAVHAFRFSRDTDWTASIRMAAKTTIILAGWLGMNVVV